MTNAQTDEFATAWLAAWNRHDLDAIMSHYAADITFASPFVAKLTGRADGTVQGQGDLRAYFARALEAYPQLEFTLINVLAGINSVVLYYHSVNDLLAAEVFEFDADGKVCRVWCHYVMGAVSSSTTA